MTDKQFKKQLQQERVANAKAIAEIRAARNFLKLYNDSIELWKLKHKNTSEAGKARAGQQAKATLVLKERLFAFAKNAIEKSSKFHKPTNSKIAADFLRANPNCRTKRTLVSYLGELSLK